MKIESEILKHALREAAQTRMDSFEVEQAIDIIENLEQQQIDAPMQTRALWTSLGHHAELTYQGKHWTLRAFPGGFSAKCNDTGAFHIGEAADLPSAMLAAEEFVLGEAENAEPSPEADGADLSGESVTH